MSGGGRVWEATVDEPLARIRRALAQSGPETSVMYLARVTGLTCAQVADEINASDDLRLAKPDRIPLPVWNVVAAGGGDA